MIGLWTIDIEEEDKSVVDFDLGGEQLESVVFVDQR